MATEKELYLKRALRLAARGKGLTSPNPLVGAVLVKSGRIIGEGYHRYFGGDHAEVDALKKTKGFPEGSTLYINLEPCCHFGKTPPCTEILIKNRIKKVIAAMADPNPLVSGKGFKRLQEAGIEVEVGLLEEESCDLNQPYFARIKKERPFVAVKIAQSLDGKIASHTGQSKWVTGEIARAFSHRLRFEYDAILVGINTILSDNPSLDYHPPGLPHSLLTRKRYLKVILDSQAQLPLTANVWQGKGRVVVATTKKAPSSRVKILEEKGAQVIIAGVKRVDLTSLIKILHRKEVGSILVEGGAETNGSFVDAGMVDLLYLFQAPLILGGKNAVSSVGGRGFPGPDKSLRFELKEEHYLAPDYLFVYSATKPY